MIKEKMNKLSTEIRRMIEAHNPMSLSDYMQVCASHPLYGYYMRKIFL